MWFIIKSIPDTNLIRFFLKFWRYHYYCMHNELICIFSYNCLCKFAYNRKLFLYQPKLKFPHIHSLTKAPILSRANTFLEIGIIYNLLYLLFLHFWKMPNSSSFPCTACWVHNFWARKENYISKCSGKSVLLENTINTIFEKIKSTKGTFRHSTPHGNMGIWNYLFKIYFHI